MRDAARWQADNRTTKQMKNLINNSGLRVIAKPSHDQPVRIIAAANRVCYRAASKARMGGPMTAIDALMLEAKQAIMEEHHHRFQTLRQEGRWGEALQQVHVTLSCATDLLNESLRVLNETLDGRNGRPDEPTPPPATGHH